MYLDKCCAWFVFRAVQWKAVSLVFVPTLLLCYLLLFLVHIAVSVAADILLRGDLITINKLLGSAQLAVSHSWWWHLLSLLCFKHSISAGLFRPDVHESVHEECNEECWVHSCVFVGPWQGDGRDTVTGTGKGRPEVLWICQALQWVREDWMPTVK